MKIFMVIIVVGIIVVLANKTGLTGCLDNWQHPQKTAPSISPKRFAFQFLTSYKSEKFNCVNGA